MARIIKLAKIIKLRKKLQLDRVKQAARLEYAKKKGDTTAAEIFRTHLNTIDKELKALQK